MSLQPKITIGIVTYNRRRHVQRVLDHVLADPYPNKEVVVVDGGSRDGTAELLASYGDRIARWLSERDRGEYDAWNKLNALATGDLIKWLPDDDLLRHGACDFAARWFADHPEVDMLWGQATTWFEHEFGQWVKHAESSMTDASRLTKAHLLRQTHGLNSVALFVRRRLIGRLGPFRIDMACGDTEYWVRAADQGVQMAVVPEVFVDYTIAPATSGQIKYAHRIARDLLRINWMYGTPADVARTLWERKLTLTGATVAAHHAGQWAGRHGVHPLRTLRALRQRIVG